jgi:O-antigen/teichoic acid export membrane protein
MISRWLVFPQALNILGMNRSGRSLINYITSICLQVMQLGIAIISTPLLLHWLGDNRYGAFRAATDWTNYIGLLELGVGGALSALIAKALGSGDKSKVGAILATGMRIYLQILAVMIIVYVGLGWFITDLVPVKASLQQELKLGYWISGLGFLFFPLTPLQFLVSASQRSYAVNILLGFQSALITSGNLLFAKLGLGIPGQYISILLGTAFFQLSLVWQEFKNYPHLFTSIFTRNPKIEQEVWQLNVPTLLLNLSGRVALLTDNIIIAANLGAVAVVPFFVTQRLAAIAQSQIQGLGNASWASLAELYFHDELDKFNARLIELTRLVAIMAIALLVPIVCFNHHFINIWVGTSRYAGDWVNVLSGVNAFLLGLLSLWGWVFSGTANVAKIVPASLTTSGINLVASLVFTRWLGLPGPLMGTLAGFTISICWTPLLLKQNFGISLPLLFWAFIKPLCFGIPYMVGLWWLSRSFTPWGWLGLGLEMSVSALLYLAIAWLMIIEPEERDRWYERIKPILDKILRRSEK